MLSPVQEVQRPLSPKMFHVQNRQGRKGSSAENRDGLSMVPGELGTQSASPDL